MLPKGLVQSWTLISFLMKKMEAAAANGQTCSTGEVAEAAAGQGAQPATGSSLHSGLGNSEGLWARQSCLRP